MSYATEEAALPQWSVIIVTWRRPDSVFECLKHLESEIGDGAAEVIVVDASEDNRTRIVTGRFPWANYVCFPDGAGRMTSARNEGLLHASGRLVAFVDDDAYVRKGWLAALSAVFEDPRVGAAAGRTCNGDPGEEDVGREMIGRVLPNGDITGNFAADVETPREVDHGIGANMAFRRTVLAELGGFRDDFVGVGGVREDTDMFLRVRGLGYRVIFQPSATADHVGAPHARGRRFDYRYLFSARRNHVLLLARNYGLCSPELRRWIWSEIRRTDTTRASLLRRGVRRALAATALIQGLTISLRKARCQPVDPRRRDSQGSEIRRRLASGG